jgi:hypothetical protein
MIYLDSAAVVKLAHVELAAQDRYLVPQHQDLHVFRCVATDKQYQQREQTGHSEVDEADEHERRGRVNPNWLLAHISRDDNGVYGPAVQGGSGKPGRTGHSRALGGAVRLIVCSNPRKMGGRYTRS